MKKLIAILVIAIVLVGSVFAATNEELLITVEVKCVEPTFALIGGTATSAPTASADLSSGKTGITVTTAAQASNNHTSTSTISLADDAIINGNVVIYCFVKQTTVDAKSKTTYKFSATATPLTDGTNSTGNPTVSDFSAITGSNVTGGRTTTTTSTGAQTQYAGKKCPAADLASFNVAWEQTDLPPGNYNAYITLTISTN